MSREGAAHFGLPASRTPRLVLTLFISFHIVFITLWVLPLNPSMTRVVRKWIGPYFSLVGLRQEW